MFGLSFGLGSRDYLAMARIGFVFDMETLVSTDSLGNRFAREGAADVLSYLHPNIAFVVLHNGVKVTEKEMTDLLNSTLFLSPPMKHSKMVISNSPLREIIGPDALDPTTGKTVLVIGGTGEKARRLAFQYGYPYVITTADVARLYDGFRNYHNPSNDPPENPEPAEAAYYDRRVHWRPTKRNKHLKIEGILVFWEPLDWELDADVIISIMRNGGRLGYDLSADNAALPPAEVAEKITRNMPPLHICMADIEQRFSPSGGRILGVGADKSWPRFLQSKWIEKTKNSPSLMYKMYGNPPNQTLLQFVERTLENADHALYAKIKGCGPRDEIDVPPMTSVYAVGVPLEGKYQSMSGRKWRDIFIGRQQDVPRGRRIPDIVATNLKQAVEHALVEGYQRAGELGVKPMWTRPDGPNDLRQAQGPQMEELEMNGVATRGGGAQGIGGKAKEVIADWLGGVASCSGCLVTDQ